MSLAEVAFGMTIFLCPLCHQTAVRKRIHTAFTVNILLSMALYTKLCAHMPVSHLSAPSGVTAGMVGGPTNTGSLITRRIQYNATYVSLMMNNPIKCTQTPPVLQIPINFSLTKS